MALADLLLADRNRATAAAVRSLEAAAKRLAAAGRPERAHCLGRCAAVRRAFRAEGCAAQRL